MGRSLQARRAPRSIDDSGPFAERLRAWEDPYDFDRRVVDERLIAQQTAWLIDVGSPPAATTRGASQVGVVTGADVQQREAGVG